MDFKAKQNNNYTKINFKSVFGQQFILLGGLIGLAIIFSILSHNFLLPNNLVTILLQSSVFAILAIGETFVIITSGIDLSVGSVLGLTGIIVSMLMSSHVSLLFSLVIGLLSGAIIGFINGFIITKGGVPPFIVTLGMMSIARGLALLLTDGIPVSGFPASFQFIGNYNVFGWIPMPVVLMIILAVIFSIVLTKTKIGRYTYAIGSNEEATRLSGINVARVKMIVYTISGSLAGFAGIILTSRLFSGQPTAGNGYEMNAIAATVIGGASLMGGEGHISGTIIGALIMGTIANGLNLLNVSPFMQQVITGIIIVVTVYVDTLRNKKSK
jgi:ribose transport system permease protein